MSLANSALRVSARNRIDGASFEQVTERLPVLIGRDPTVATVVLPDNLKVSRVHASLELRGEDLYVRDARSVNGTVVNGQMIPPETWVPLGRGDVPREFAISDWLFTVACVQPPQALTVAASSFGNETGRRVLGLHATIASDALADTGMAFPAMPSLGAPPTAPSPTNDSGDSDAIAGAYERYHQASKTLYELIVHELEAMAPAERRAAATVLVRRHSMLVDDPAFAALLRSYGAPVGSASSPPPSAQVRQLAIDATQPMPQVAPPPPPARVHFPTAPVTSPEQVALKAMQYLSTWYVGRAAVTSADIGSFTDQPARHARRADARSRPAARRARSLRAAAGHQRRGRRAAATAHAGGVRARAARLERHLGQPGARAPSQLRRSDGAPGRHAQRRDCAG